MEPTEEELWESPAAKRRKLGLGPSEEVEDLISVGMFKAQPPHYLFYAPRQFQWVFHYVLCTFNYAS